MLEILLLVIAHTDAAEFLQGESRPVLAGREWHCARCGRIEPDDVEVTPRHEGCRLFCRACGSVVEEELPF